MTAPQPAERQPTGLDRFLAVVPVAVAALVVISILLWEAASLKSPTVFGDELEWAFISHSIAHTGHGALLGQGIGFRSVFPYLIAPFWWLSTTQSTYTAIKYADTLLMATAAIPTYLLARTLVSKPWAAAVALGTLCTSAFFYAPLLLPEVPAYPFYALTAYVAVQALAGRGRRWTIAAVALSLASALVRNQLVVSVGALALAAAWLWLVGPRGRRLRAGWSVADHVGAGLLLVGTFVVLNRYGSPHVHQWDLVSQSAKGKIWNLGLESGSALAIGLGVLPMIGGLASLWVPERRADPRWRAFAAYLGASIVTFGTYTGVKAAYNATQVFTRVEERNLIYLGPLLLIGTAIVLSTRRAWLPGLLVAGGVVGWLVLGFGYQLNYPYSDAPGYGIATMANRAFYWTQSDIRIALAVALLLSMGVLLLSRSSLPAAARRGAVGLAVLTVATWMMAGQVTSARGSMHAASQSVGGLEAIGATPLDWVDRTTHGTGTTYLGQDLSPPLGNPIGLWLTEFWNPSIKHTYTLDSSSPGPGPTVTPGLSQPDGTLTDDPGLPYVLADGGITLQARKAAPPHGTLILYHLTSHPWRLEQALLGRTGDGWIIGSNDEKVANGTYAYFGPQRSVGTLSVQISRTFCPAAAPDSHATVRVGPVKINIQQKPVVRNALFVRHVTVCADPAHPTRTLTFRIRPPVAVEVRISPTIRPADYGSGDARQLGAQVGFSWKP